MLKSSDFNILINKKNMSLLQNIEKIGKSKLVKTDFYTQKKENLKIKYNKENNETINNFSALKKSNTFHSTFLATS